MRNPFPAVNEGVISDWVGPRSFQRGRSYFEEGAILDPRLQGNTLKAWCQGSMLHPYRLWVACNAEGIEEADCSCPVGGGGRCKHIGALLLAWLEHPDTFRVAEELDTGLEQRSKLELIALIKQMLQVQPDLEALVEAALSAGDRSAAPVAPESFRRQVALAFRSSGDVWHAAQHRVSDIGIALSTGDGFLTMSDHANAGIVYQAVVQGMLEHYEMLPGDDEYLWEVVNRCVKGLGNCLAAGDGDVAARQQSLQALFALYRFDLDYGGYGMGEGAEVLILEHATQEERSEIAGWVRAAMPKGNDWRDDHQRRKYGGFLLELEADHLDDDAFLEICRVSGRLAELVDRLLALGRLDEALAEVDGAGDSDLLLLAEIFGIYGHGRRLEPLLASRIATTHIHGLVEWLKGQYEERGELAEALALAKRLLGQHPGLAEYREVRELSRRLGIWQESRSELLAQWATARQYDLLTDVYLEEGEIDQALKLVKQHGRIYAFAAGQLIRVAQAASETHPQASVEIYREQAERLLKARGRGNYRKACVYLTRMRDLYRGMAREAGWTNFIVGIRERHGRLPALMDELGKAGL